ncbi:MAG TPA: TfoX/Sxy family protein [Rhizomicrobium sp.]
MMSDPDRFADLFQHFGPVTARRMFGGEGLFAGDVMIGIVGDGDEIFLKTNETTRAAYLDENARQFVFHMRSKPAEVALTSYYSLPPRLCDDPEELARWAKEAHEVASQTETAKRKQRQRLRETTARQPAGRRTRR